MSDYPLFIPEFMLYTKSSLLWFKITTKLREFRNYLLFFIFIVFLFSLFCQILLHSLIELLSRVISHLFLSVVYCC